jgi:pimeloyl-ACP methyl ester carboxylesterase
MPFVQTRGKQLEYFEQGEGSTPIILIHGAGSSALIWDQVQTLMAGQGYRTIAISLPGAGGSDHSDNLKDYNPISYAADIRGALDSLGMHNCVFVGHSLGVQNVLGILADHGEGLKVPAMILMAGGACDVARLEILGTQRDKMIESFGSREPAPEEPTATWTRQHQGLPAETRHRLWQDILNNPMERVLGQRLGELRDRTGLLIELDIPTLIVSGDRDEVVPLERTLNMYPKLKEENRHMHVLHGVGHFPNAQVPEEISALYCDFLSEHLV